MHYIHLCNKTKTEYPEIFKTLCCISFTLQAVRTTKWFDCMIAKTPLLQYFSVLELYEKPTVPDFHVKDHCSLNHKLAHPIFAYMEPTTKLMDQHRNTTSQTGNKISRFESPTRHLLHFLHLKHPDPIVPQSLEIR